MNRRKKLNNILKKKSKKATAKLGSNNKKTSTYISKAERAQPPSATLSDNADLTDG